MPFALYTAFLDSSIFTARSMALPMLVKPPASSSLGVKFSAVSNSLITST